MAKKLQPKMTAYMPIIDRGAEDKNVQVWSFNKFVYQRLLDFFTNAEVNPDLIDYMDPNEGIDLLVIIKPSGKKFNNKDVMDTQIDLGRRQSKLSNDPATAKRWLDSVPNIDDIYQPKSEKEMEQALNIWLAGGVDTTTTSDEGTSRGNPDRGKDELDKLVDDVKAVVPTKTEKPAVTAAPAIKPVRKASKPVEVDIDAAPAAKTSLDAAFDELMKDKNDDSDE
jgi:hypothetical protein